TVRLLKNASWGYFVVGGDRAGLTKEENASIINDGVKVCRVLQPARVCALPKRKQQIASEPSLRYFRRANDLEIMITIAWNSPMAAERYCPTCSFRLRGPVPRYVKRM